MKWDNLAKPCKKLLMSPTGLTAGRNSAGRITIFHRGGGAKRLQRRIDLKRSTSSMGVVERIEYDPNRSARIALVRWIEGVQPDNRRKSEKGFAPTDKNIDAITTNVAGEFPLACFSPNLMHTNVKNPSNDNKEGGKLNNVKDVFLSAFSSPKAKEAAGSIYFGGSLALPRIAVAGAKPAVFAPQLRGEEVKGEKVFSLSDVQRWNKDSVLWEHRLKRKAAVSWRSFVRGEDSRTVRAAEDNAVKQRGKGQKDPVSKIDRAPLTYIIASNELEAGKVVMNCDWSKHSTAPKF